MALRARIESAVAALSPCPLMVARAVCSYAARDLSSDCATTHAAETTARGVAQTESTRPGRGVPMVLLGRHPRQNETVPTRFDLSLAPGPV